MRHSREWVQEHLRFGGLFFLAVRANHAVQNERGTFVMMFGDEAWISRKKEHGISFRDNLKV